MDWTPSELAPKQARSTPVMQDAVRSQSGGRGPLCSVGALYAHALAMGHEAQARYREFAERMSLRGDDVLAHLFGRLADFETEHAFHLAKRSIGVRIPTIDCAGHGWLETGDRVPQAREFVLRMMTPRVALQIALQAEERGKAFFERIGAESPHADVRKLAAELGAYEAGHLAWVKEAIEHLPERKGPVGDPTIEQQR